MATAKRTKANLEFLLVKAEVKGIPEKGLLRSRNIGQVDLIWHHAGLFGLSARLGKRLLELSGKLLIRTDYVKLTY